MACSAKKPKQMDPKWVTIRLNTFALFWGLVRELDIHDCIHTCFVFNFSMPTCQTRLMILMQQLQDSWPPMFRRNPDKSLQSESHFSDHKALLLLTLDMQTWTRLIFRISKMGTERVNYLGGLSGIVFFNCLLPFIALSYSMAFLLKM